MADSRLPSIAWTRRLDHMPEEPGRRKGASLGGILGLAGPILRMRGYANALRKSGRDVYMDIFSKLDPGPVMGVPLGGIGGGTVTRGWRGDFVRWQLRPGMYEYQSAAANQFSVRVQREGQPLKATVLNPHMPESGLLHGWGWNLTGKRSTYHALYPRAWTVYEEPDPNLRLTCRQISPVIPHNYQESSTPAGVFVWTIENTGQESATISLMFTWQNGTGGPNDRAGGHSNHLFREKAKGGEIVGVELRHHYRQPLPLSEDGSPGGVAEDPLAFAIATQATRGVQVTYRTRFVSTSSGMDVWGDFRDNGLLGNIESDKPSTDGVAIAAALCARVEVPAGKSAEVVFALAWDMPLARFGEGRAYYRRYTRTYGREGKAAPAIARDAILHYADWEKQIEKWQKPVLDDDGLPDWYKAALFNELYIIADGGTVWLDAEEGQEPLPDKEIGRFAYLEGHEYRMYNTYDVHFYASWALAQLWPELELALQRDFAKAVLIEDEEDVLIMVSGKSAPHKVMGMIPHDLGGPTEDPWHLLNIYNYQDASRWKDLNPKFVLQVYRDYLITKDKRFLEETWEGVRAAMERMKEFDLDDDGLIENEGYPDQTYDQWVAEGPSAYSGGLWLASLAAAAAIADLLKKDADAKGYRDLLTRGTQSYEEVLWNGDYYDYDASRSYHADSIMADQLCGHWYLRACGLPSYAPDDHVKQALKTVYETNIQLFELGKMGAVNGMRSDGRVDTTCLQSQEVWTGTTYALAATLLHEGMESEAWETAKGIVESTYEELGYWFNTPEAWDARGDHRSLGYMRPLAIWAMQWAWARRGKK